MEVVVFGATGYLGSHVVEQLILAGHSVTGVVRRGSDARFLHSISCFVKELDFTESAIEKVISEGACVVNCIADTRMHLSDRQRAKVEVELTSRIFTCAERAGASKFLQLSTVMVYGADRPAHPIDESYPLRPKYSYSRIARQREEVLIALAESARTNLIIVRPSNTLGKRDSSALPALMGSLEKGFYPVIDGGNWRYSNTDARDVGRTFVHLLDLQCSSPEVFLVQGYEMSWIELKQQLDHYLGRSSRLLNIPKKVALALGRFLEFVFPYGSSPPLTRFMVETMSTHALFDDSKLRATGFAPRYSLRETLDDALADQECVT